MISRRRLFASTGLSAAALLGVGAAASPAFAFREEKATVQDLWAVRDAQARCRAVSSHDQMLAVLQAELAGGTLTPEQRRRVMASATCPTCGRLLGG